MTSRFSAVRLAALALLLLTAAAAPLSAEEVRLPSASELESFSHDATPLYTAGIAALDRADYGNAYSYLAKAAQLQPAAVRLNQLVAALALKLGRSKNSLEARGYYETAVVSYQGILRNPGLEEDVRLQTENRLKVALDERDKLEERDAKRQAFGSFFVLDLNRELSREKRQEEAAALATPAPTPVLIVSTPPAGLPSAALVPGAPTPAYPSGPAAPAPGAPPAAPVGAEADPGARAL